MVWREKFFFFNKFIYLWLCWVFVARDSSSWRGVALWHVGSSRTRARTHVACISRQILNHCTTREAPDGSGGRAGGGVFNRQNLVGGLRGV